MALSGGADSLALTVACAVLISTRAGERLGPVGAAVVDHGLQDGSAAVAAAAARTARRLGLSPVTVARVAVAPTGDGPEAAARTEAVALVESDRGLADHPELAAAVAALSMDDRADWLERA